MVGHVERWRRAGEWRSRFPDHLVDRNKRIDWSFWFNDDGSAGEGMLALPEDAIATEMVLFHLRNAVPFDDDTPLPIKWLREHLSGVWQLWNIKGERHIHFEFVEDAVHFKLVYYAG